MAYLKFKKGQLVNLDYSLHREFLATNRAGGYMSSTIIGCNTRKYHGLFIVPIKEFGDENYVLLSQLDETIIQHGHEFNLGIHKYPNCYEPKGNKYIVDFEYEPIFTLSYRVGGVLLKKEIIMVHDSSQIMIRYTLLEAHSETILRLKPFLAYRRTHDLSKANLYVNKNYGEITYGISSRLYDGFPTLNMQINKKNEFIPVPDWYYNVEYVQELNRGYEGNEDLYTPGYFEMKMERGESIVFSASLNEENPIGFKTKFQRLLNDRMPRNSMLNCLKYSASQFIVKKNGGTEIVAGYPWFGSWGRDTFIALPGITLYANKDIKTFKSIINTMIKKLNGGLFPNVIGGNTAAYNSADASMWFFKAIQEYADVVKDNAAVWKSFGSSMKQILEAYRKGINDYIKMDKNYLIWANEPNKALTWMDAIVDGNPVTPRGGYQVEVNALWYNAICFTLLLANTAEDKDFLESWSDMPEKVRKSFIKVFWNDDKKYLADYVDLEIQHMEVRPNQIFACSLKYSPLTDDMRYSVIKVVKSELLTPRGLRTLSPKNKDYDGFYMGDQAKRDRAYHQGTVWPWLIGAYIEANFRLQGARFINKAKEILKGFEEKMTEYGVCSISEVNDGNPPFAQGGCISQAWSVGEILRSEVMLEDYANEKKIKV